MQIRADDEGSTLVRSCPIHGIHYDLCQSYRSLSSGWLWTEESNPTRLAHGVSGVNETLIENTISYDTNLWFYCTIDLQEVDIHRIDQLRSGSSSYKWAVNTRFDSGSVDVGAVYLDHPLFSHVSGNRIVRLSEIKSNANYTSNYVLYKRTPAAQVLRSVAMFESSINLSILDSSNSNSWYFVCKVDRQYKFGYLHLTSSKEWSEDLLEQCIRRCHVKCSTLLGTPATIGKNRLWNDWRFPFLRLLSTQQLCSVDLSEVTLSSDSLVKCISAKGTYCLILIFSYCVIRINRSLTVATLLDVEPAWSFRTGEQPIVAYSGYYHESTFTILNSWQYDMTSGITAYSGHITDVVDSVVDTKLSFETCVTSGHVSDKWRLLYLGHQTSITVVRRQPKLSTRTMDRSCILSLIHKMIVSRLVKMNESGFEFTLLIKSHPFEFYRPISDKWKCIFVYEQDWSRHDDPDMTINLDRHEGEDDWLNLDQPSSYSYERDELIMDIHQAHDITECIRLASPGSPIHCNSPTSSVTYAPYSTSQIILLDFYNQDPLNIPYDANYISVLGEREAKSCIDENVIITGSICYLNINNQDLSEFCKSTNQTLDGIKAVCTDMLESYLSTEETRLEPGAL